MFILYILLAYLLGSIPFGLLICSKIKKIDIREHGSKNIGATNVFRVAGKGLGILVLVLDAAKGSLAVLAPVLFFQTNLASSLLLLLGITAILGHTFPIWLKFKGGKGVATSLGVFLAVCPVPTLSALGVFALVLGIGRILSVASLAAALSFPVCVFLTSKDSPDPWLLGTSILLILFIFYTHRANISRIFRGEEKRIF